MWWPRLALILWTTAVSAGAALAQLATGESRQPRLNAAEAAATEGASAAASRYELPAEIEAAIARLATGATAGRTPEKRPPRVIPLAASTPAPGVPLPPVRPPAPAGADAPITGDVGIAPVEGDEDQPMPRSRRGTGDRLLGEDGDDEPPRGFTPLQSPRARIQPPGRDRASGADLAEDNGESRRGDRVALPALSRAPVAMLVRALPLEVALKEIGKMTGHTVHVATGVEGTLRDRMLEGPVDRIFDSLADEFSLFWFSDGLVIHVDPRDDQKSHLFRIGDMSRQQFNARLAETGLARFRARIQFNGREGFVRVTGSDAFIRTVETALSVPKEEPGGKVEVIRFGISSR